MRRSFGFQSSIWSASASTPGRWCANLFARPCDRYQPFETNLKIGYMADNLPLPSSLQRKTAAASRIYPLKVRADLIVVSKIFAGKMDIDLSMLFSSPPRPTKEQSFSSIRLKIFLSFETRAVPWSLTNELHPLNLMRRNLSGLGNSCLSSQILLLTGYVLYSRKKKTAEVGANNNHLWS